MTLPYKPCGLSPVVGAGTLAGQSLDGFATHLVDGLDG